MINQNLVDVENQLQMVQVNGLKLKIGYQDYEIYGFYVRCVHTEKVSYVEVVCKEFKVEAVIAKYSHVSN